MAGLLCVEQRAGIKTLCIAPFLCLSRFPYFSSTKDTRAAMLFYAHFCHFCSKGDNCLKDPFIYLWRVRYAATSLPAAQVNRHNDKPLESGGKRTLLKLRHHCLNGETPRSPPQGPQPTLCCKSIEYTKLTDSSENLYADFIQQAVQQNARHVCLYKARSDM